MCRGFCTLVLFILLDIVSVLSSFIAPPSRFSADLGYLSLSSTFDQRSNIVMWNNMQRSLILLELTISSDISFQQAAERKRAKYCDVIEKAQSAGFHARLLTIQVGSKCTTDIPSFVRTKEGLWPTYITMSFFLRLLWNPTKCGVGETPLSDSVFH